jgi:competence protein ComEC
MKGRDEPGIGGGAAGLLLAAGWLAGCAWQVRQPGLWPLAVYAGCALGAAALLLLVRWLARGTPAVVVAAVALVVFGFGSTGWRAAVRLADALPAELEGRDLVLTGTVAQMPRHGPAGLRFVFDVDEARLAGEPVAVPRRVSLGWYRGPDGDAFLDGPAGELRAGQRWRFTARLKQPHGSMNPHGFDLELWLFEQGVRAGGSVRSRAGDAAVKLGEGAAHPFERLRQQVRDAIVAQVPNATAAGVLAALAVGDQAAIERDDWDLFRATGVAHLMSISGLHVTMFAWLAGRIVETLWRRSARLMLAVPAPQAARWGGLAAAALYALLAGWGVPAQRTVWMIAAVVLLRTLGLRWPFGLVLAAAAVVVTVLDPWALLQPGFWLSFVAVALLVASEPARRNAPRAETWRQRLVHALRGGLRTQLVATVGLAPLSMVFFQQVSIVGFAANLVAIPVVTLLVTPLALVGVLLPPLWVLAAAAAQALVAYLGTLAAWPLAVWTAAAAPPWAVACGLLGGLVLVLPLPWRLRAPAALLMLPLLVPPVERPAPGTFELVAADVGQGSAVLVRTAQHLLVYDTGPQYSPEADAGQRVLLPLLRARGEREIDLLVVSHADSDHAGGAASLAAGVPIRAFASSLPAGHPLQRVGRTQSRCEAGQAWDWDGVHFAFVHPTAAEHAAATKPNAVSCVLRVSSATRSALLAGDVEAAQEAALLARGEMLAADVLLVPHHGSRTSSTEAFIAAVVPRVAVVQAAYRSRFGHPAPDVVARYEARAIEVVRSDRCGAWTWTADEAAPPVCERLRSRRYWHHGAPPPEP